MGGGGGGGVVSYPDPTTRKHYRIMYKYYVQGHVVLYCLREVESGYETRGGGGGGGGGA